MGMRKKACIISCIISLVVLCGCATTAFKTSGNLGKGAYRHVVILGEHYSNDVAAQYADKYNATVLYTAGRGFLANAVSSSLRGAIGPSRSMRDLILELESMNHTAGEWVLIVPPSSESYFFVTLQNMDDDALRDADASVFLIKSVKNKGIESEMMRISGAHFKVKYGEPFQNR